MTPDTRAELSALIGQANAAAAGMTDRAFQIADRLIDPPPLADDDMSRALEPDIKTELVVQDVREAQRTAANAAQALAQLRSLLQRHALGFVLREDGDSAAGTVRSIVWQQLRQANGELGLTIDVLKRASATACGPGPIRNPGDPPYRAGLVELLAVVRAEKATSPAATDPPANPATDDNGDASK